MKLPTVDSVLPGVYLHLEALGATCNFKVASSDIESMTYADIMVFIVKGQETP